MDNKNKKLFLAGKFKYGASAVVFTVVFIVFIITLNFALSVIENNTGSLTLDVTNNEMFSVSKESEKALLGVDKEIEIIAVADPVKMDNLSKDQFDEEYEGFPPGAVTRVEYAPRIIGKSEANYHKRFIEHSRKIDRWMMEHCDTLIAFRYDNIPDAVNTEVDRIKKRTDINVITIFDPSVKKYVDDTIDRMEGREGAILRGLRDGKTYQNLGEEFGVSLHRIRQISNRMLRHIFSNVRKNIMREN